VDQLEVMEQAYLYRMAGTLDMDRISLVEDSVFERPKRVSGKRRVELFCNSMKEIEKLRLNQMKKLKRSLQVQELPSGMSLSDPKVIPFLSPKVRAVVEAFPLQAELIVQKYGLSSDEFNRLLDQTKANPLFRFRVENYLRGMEGK
jgi:Domain of unknown function (DUF4168)